MGKQKSAQQKAAKVEKKEKAKRAKKDKVDDGDEVMSQVKEIEERLQTITEESKKVEAKMRACAMEAKHCELTIKELEPIQEATVLYRGVGRCFIKAPKSSLISGLKAQVAEKTAEVPRLKLVHASFEIQMKSEAENLKEVMGPERMREMFGRMNLKKDGTGDASASSDGSLARIAEEEVERPLFSAASRPAAEAPK